MSTTDMNNAKAKKRKKVKLAGPVNELFIQWLEEWYTETAMKGSKIQYAFGKALVSLKRYPLPLKSGKECLILEHFGPGICVKLDRRLSEYKKEHPDLFPDDEEEPNNVEPVDTQSSDVVEVLNSPPAKKANKSPKKSSYMPAKNSVAFAVFVAMHENGLDCSIEEQQLQIVVKRIINKPCPSSCMDNLIKRGLVVENSNSDVFTLTRTGREVAELVYAKYLLSKGRPDRERSNNDKIMSYNSRLTDFDLIPLGSSNPKDEPKEVINLDDDANSATSSQSSRFKNEIIQLDSQTSQSQFSSRSQSSSQMSSKSEPSDSQTSTQSELNSQASSEDTVCMLPNSFDVILIVDNHETGARMTVQTETIEELTKLGVKHDVKGLKIGDFTWIARDAYGNELVLPYIVERKRMDDFAQSIKDSRFQEQKFRLKKCGLKNLIYLVENYGSNMFLGLPLTSVLQAATNTEVIDKFTVKFTQNHADSMVYLQGMTTFLTSLYRGKTLMSTTSKDEITQDFEEDILNLLKFKQFNQMSNKARNYKVKEMFVKQMMQLSGLSLAKAMVIVEKYPTPLLLINAFHEHGHDLLADLKYTQLGTRIGNAISNALYQFYTRQTFT
uniref:Crossover junction endonuclease MUS81 n=1 Tax=Cacopsylla melanoneura TaxID=428564 RepID=A0A8D8SZB6_9HEMI